MDMAVKAPALHRNPSIMNESDLFLVIIAGGNGTRFWPKSTSKKPKQLLSFGGSNDSLLAQTLARFENWVPSHQRMIVTTQALSEAIQSERLTAKILAEPQGRNTAPCIYWAARSIAEKNPDAVMVIMPADHYIANPGRFLSVVKTAARWASEHRDLVTLGIQPNRPETGYGYLKTSSTPLSSLSISPSNQSSSQIPVTRVEAFVEKPNFEKATEFLKNGNYLWNGGMFLWQVNVILEAFDRFMPEMKRAWEKAEGRIEKAYPEMTATSIDYGIMEKAENVVTLPLDCGWDDLGSWTSLEGLADPLNARHGNNVLSSGELLAIDSSNNIVDAPDRLIALLGVNDLIVVEHGGALLVTRKDKAQDIRKVVEEVKRIRPDLA